MPKSYSVEHTEFWALTIARPLKIAEYILLPLVITFDFPTRQSNRLTGGESGIAATYVTREELQYLINTGERESAINEDERDMFRRIFRLEDRITGGIMTPHLDMTALAVDTPSEAAIETDFQSEFSRFPVYENDLDTTIGSVHLRDLINQYIETGGTGDLTDCVRLLLRVPETKDVDDLLTEMRGGRHRMALVIDEFGTVAGIVTLEDLLEEVVGELLEQNENEPLVIEDNRSVVVRGDTTIEEINEVVDISLPEDEEFETIAEFILDRTAESSKRVKHSTTTVSMSILRKSRTLAL